MSEAQPMSAAIRPTRIGVIGVGEMGRPLVGRLKAAGHSVAAFVRRPELAAELTAEGVEVAPSIADLAKGREYVIVYVFKDEQTQALAPEIVAAMDPGSILIVKTTGSPKTMAAIAERARPRGVGVVDAPGSGGPHKIAGGDITLLVGGAAEDVERCKRDVFAAYAGPVIHIGELGAGQALKLINNAMFGAHIELALEAARLGEAFGLDAGEVAKALTRCSGGSAAIEILAGAKTPEVLLQRTGKFVHKDVAVAEQLAAELGIDLGVLGQVNAPLMAVLDDMLGKG
jgi:3-hydroxyisobutyrate dehydrogenase-like beta-hydroxyacid dehydrogenase